MISKALRETADANRTEMPLMTIKQLVEPQFVVDYENIQEVNNENN